MKQRLLIALSGIVLVFLGWMGLKPTSTEATETCPDGGAWQKDDTSHNGFDETCSGGKKVTQVCIKGGTNVKYFTTNGNDGCWARSGIGTNEGDAWKIGSGSSCKDISHASFKCETVSPTATPTLTPQPTLTPTNMPTPTQTPCTSPTLTPTQMPTATPTAVPSPTNNPNPSPTEVPEPTPTEVPEVTPEPTQEPEATPEPTEEPGRGGVSEDNKTSSLEVNETNCDNSFTAKMTLKDNDKAQENFMVGFHYKDQVFNVVTNNEGSATANFTYTGKGDLRVEASGYDTEYREITGPENCDAVSGQVLGASTYADTGMGNLSDILGLYTLGTIMIAGGVTAYARSKKQK